MRSSMQTSSFKVREASGVQRTGLKGRGAADLLASLGIAVPPRANQVLRFAGPPAGRCLRLGNTEFLLEQDDGDALLRALDTALQAAPGSVLGALRRDHCFLLSGAGARTDCRQNQDGQEQNDRGFFPHFESPSTNPFLGVNFNPPEGSLQRHRRKRRSAGTGRCQGRPDHGLIIPPCEKAILRFPASFPF